MRGQDHRQEHSYGRTLCGEVLNQAHSTCEWGSLVRILPLGNAPRAVDMSAGGGWSLCHHWKRRKRRMGV